MGNFKNTLLVSVLLTCLSATGVMANPTKEQDLREKFAAVSLGYAIDQVCDFSENHQKVGFLAEYIEARWWLWRARTGVENAIAKKMGEKAWRLTAAGSNCGAEAEQAYDHGLYALTHFAADAQAVFGEPSQSLLNPKPQQKHIFATYQLARYGWILAKKCDATPSETPINAYYQQLLSARKMLLQTFRPDQLASLDKATNEMIIWGTSGSCTPKRLDFIKMAYASINSDPKIKTTPSVKKAPTQNCEDQIC
jgi:hypothetical protein